MSYSCYSSSFEPYVVIFKAVDPPVYFSGEGGKSEGLI
jgi:hypothetical protein